MKFKRKIMSIVTCLICAASMVNIPLNGLTNANADTAKPIDMYLIAGQSNAAGYSLARDSGDTFENVWYAGQTDRESVGVSHICAGSDTTQAFVDFKQQVTVGLGKSSRHIGPEYGMASVLSSSSTAEHPSMIFKTAAGSTGLLDEYGTEYGNWYPRSLWEEGYEPVVDSISNDETGTGVMYELFLGNFKRVYDELIANGYAPQVKGMAWMQGERDSTNNDLDKYAEVLEIFITDIRADLVQITGDATLTGMPFVIGELADTFGCYNNTQAIATANKQKQVAEKMSSSRVASFSTSDFIINDENGNTVGTDLNHFSYADAKTLGQRFANKLLELNEQKFVAIDEKDGKVSCVIEGDNLNVTLTPKQNYKLSQLLLNGTDVTSNVVNNGYKTTLQQAANILTAKFIEKTKYSVTYETAVGAGCQFTPQFSYEGDVLSLKVYPAKDYEITEVLYNDTEMTYNVESKCYEIHATADGTVKIETKYVGTANEEDSDSTSESKKKSGCSSAIVTVGVIPVLSVAAVAVAVGRKRKKN